MTTNHHRASGSGVWQHLGFVAMFVIAIAVVIVYIRLFEKPYLSWYWGCVLALLPAVAVALQAFYLIYIKRYAVRDVITTTATVDVANPPPSGGPRKASAPVTNPPPQETADRKNRTDLAPTRENALSLSDRYFHPFHLGLQYSVLAALLAVVSLTLVSVCIDPPPILRPAQKAPLEGLQPATAAFQQATSASRAQINTAASSGPRPADSANKPGSSDPQATRAALAASLEIGNSALLSAIRLGAAGAYIYVLIYLGRRSFQRDITSGAALWSAVQLLLGPTLAGTIAYFLSPAPLEAGGVSFSAIYFLAGLSPRMIADWISDTVQRSWMSGGGQAPARRLTPLGTIRGITASIESRLSEEGIEDTAGMAAANPVKLLRTTPFDPRQILGWIDEAILICTLPTHWEELEPLGITGAIDLAWYALENDEEVPAPKPPGPKLPTRPATLAIIAKRLNLDEQILSDIAERLLYDDQLEVVWAIYESNAEDQTP